MSDREREYRLFVQSGCRCTGTTKAGDPCRARVSCGACADFRAGVSDRCLYHVDEVEQRSREIARIARRSGASEVEALRKRVGSERLSGIHTNAHYVTTLKQRIRDLIGTKQSGFMPENGSFHCTNVRIPDSL